MKKMVVFNYLFNDIQRHDVTYYLLFYYEHHLSFLTVLRNIWGNFCLKRGLIRHATSKIANACLILNEKM